MGKPLRSVLFDLDGTLLDTAPDLAFALNAVLREEGRSPLPLSDIKPFISRGAAGMIRLGFGEDQAETEFVCVLQRLLAVYRRHIADQTRFFEGMEEVLARLERQGLRWGIVTNKLAYLTEPLLHALHLTGRPACIISGDTTKERKPHPEPLLEACRRLGLQPAECIYIGDAQRDIEAGKRAGMGALAALYGYIGGDDNPAEWGAQAFLNRPLDLLDWLEVYRTT